jgi:radical SAM-linked protein
MWLGAPVGTVSIVPYRMHFSKRGRERFLSHLDLARLFTRAIRRSGLPIRYSEGFTPRPALSFPLALGIGIESLDEIVEIELSEDLEPAEVQSKLNAQLPAGIRILSSERFDRKDRIRIASVEYEVMEPPATADAADKADALLRRADVRVHRERGEDSKPVDIRPYLESIRVESGRWILVLKVTDGGSARPVEVLQALEISNPAQARVLKRNTNFVKGRRESSDAD